MRREGKRKKIRCGKGGDGKGRDENGNELMENNDVIGRETYGKGK